MLRAPHLRTSLITIAISTLALVGCTSDEERVMRMQEETNAIVAQTKDDCGKMAAELKRLGDAKGKDFQKAHRTLKEKTGDKVTAHLEQKFPDRMKASKSAIMAGMKCLMTEEVALAMMTIEGDGEDQPGRKPPEQPFTGAPVAFVVDKVAPGEDMAVSAYNFGDKTFAGYSILVRYYGADGKPIVANGFNRDHDSWSMSGKNYRVPAKQWRSFKLTSLKVPAGAVKADVLASAVTAVVNGGLKMEDRPSWQLSGFGWPSPTAAK
jgi:hypothetical protein